MEGALTSGVQGAEEVVRALSVPESRLSFRGVSIKFRLQYPSILDTLNVCLGIPSLFTGGDWYESLL